jgi:hypothetical protein
LGKQQGDGKLCLKRDSDAVVLCLEAEQARAFETDASLLRSLQVLSFAPSEVQALGVTTAGVEQSVKRTADGGFALEKPAGFRHDGTLVTDLIQSLGVLRAERWAATRPEAKHGLTAPSLRVRLELYGDGAPQRRELSIGAKTRDGFFASLSPDPGVFVLAEPTVLELERLLIDRALCPFSPSELRRIELRAGAKRLLLERRDDIWQAAGLPAERAQELGETLGSLRAEVALHLGPEKPEEGLSQPRLVVTYVNERDETRRLRLGASSGQAGDSTALARLDGVDATFSLAGTTAAALQSF